MYAEGYSVAEIQEVTGVRRSMLPYLALKCLERSTDGRIMGYRGLIPYSCKRYIRKAGERIWLLALIEVVSSAILSYSIVYRSEAGADDVLNVIKKAVNPLPRAYKNYC